MCVVNDSGAAGFRLLPGKHAAKDSGGACDCPVLFVKDRYGFLRTASMTRVVIGQFQPVESNVSNATIISRIAIVKVIAARDKLVTSVW